MACPIKSLFDLVVGLHLLIQFALALSFLLNFLKNFSDTIPLVSYVCLLLALSNNLLLGQFLFHLALAFEQVISGLSVLRDAASLHVKFRLLLFSECL